MSAARQSCNQTNREGAKSTKADAKECIESCFYFASSFAFFAPSRLNSFCRLRNDLTDPCRFVRIRDLHFRSERVHPRNGDRRRVGAVEVKICSSCGRIGAAVGVDGASA